MDASLSQSQDSGPKAAVEEQQAVIEETNAPETSPPPAIVAHEEAWKQVNSPGPTQVDGISLSNAQVVITTEDPLPEAQPFEGETPSAPTQQLTPPDEFVVKGEFPLFGVIPVELYTLQAPSKCGIHQRVTIPGELSLGTLVPSMANSPINAITFSNTILTYRSHRTPTTLAGLTLSATVNLSDFLEPVNLILRDVFGQKTPRIDVSGLLSTHPDCLSRVPTPSGFTLRGDLPVVNVNLFGVLDVTTLGLDIMGSRISSKGGYKYAYGFFGRGRVSDLAVNWYIWKHYSMYRIAVTTKSESWKNVGGVMGVNIENVQFEASWVNTNISGVTLQLEATFSLRESTLLLRGFYSKDNLELSGLVHDCTLTTLQHLYEDIFHTTITTTTSHTIVFSTLSFLLSTKTGVTLHGAVTVDGHTSASATIDLTASGIRITGSLEALPIGDIVTIDSAALDLTITRDAFNVQFSGSVTVQKLHFDVSVYLAKSSGEGLEYTVYGSYNGELHLRKLVKELEGTHLDVSLQKAAICVSNMEEPEVEVKENVLAYPIKKGLQIYAEASSLKAVSDILRLKDPKPVILCAFYKPGAKGGKSSFSVDVQLPTTDLISFDSMKTGPLKMGVSISTDGPRLYVIADLYIAVSNHEDPLTLQLELNADQDGAGGSARQLTGIWNNPFDMCPALSVSKLAAGIGIEYATFFTTGTPSSFTLGGAFALSSAGTTGSLLIHLSSNPKKQLISLDFKNLNVAELVSITAELLGAKIALSHGKDTFFVRKLTVYISTGITINEEDYPRGIRLDADVAVFGKNASVHAELSEDKVAIAGTIESFSLGPLLVCGARGGDPNIDIELSSDTQRIHVDGRVQMGESWIVVNVHVDIGKEEFYFLLKVVIVDALKMEIRASLEGGIPEAIEEVAGEKMIAEGKKIDLADREFTLYAMMEQDIVDYIVNLANDHFEKEGDINRLAVLLQEKQKADEEFGEAQALYTAKEAFMASVISEKENKLEFRAQELRQNRLAAEERRELLRVKGEREEQELAVKVELDKRRVEEEERAKTGLAEAAVGAARVEEAEAERELLAVGEFMGVVEKIKKRVEEAEEEFAAFEKVLDGDADGEPSKSDPGHAPWEWARRELMRQLDRKSRISFLAACVYKAKCDYDTACTTFDPETYKTATAKFETHKQAMLKAEETLKEHQRSMEERIATTNEESDGELRRFKIKLEEQTRSLRSAISKATSEEKSFGDARQSALDKVKKANNIKQTEEYDRFVEARKKRDEADVAYRSFDDLVHLITVAGAFYTAPLRFTVKQLGGKLLNIKKIVIKGHWSNKATKENMVTAHVDAIVGLVSFDFNIEFDISDIVKFFDGLWREIKRVINDVGNTMQNVLKQGEQALKDALDDFEKGATVALVAVGGVFEDVGGAVGEVFEDVGNAVGGVVEDVWEVVEDIGDAVGGIVEDIGGAVGGVAEDVGEVVGDVGNAVGGVVEDIGDAVGGVVEDVGNAVGGVVEDAGEVVEHIGDAVCGVVEDVGEVVEDIGDAVGGVVEDVGEVVEDIGEVVEDVGEVVEDVGNAIGGFFRDLF